MLDALIVPQAGIIPTHKHPNEPEDSMDDGNLSWRLSGHTSAGLREQRGGRRGIPLESLFLVDEMAAAVLLPASFVAFGAERFFLAVTDRLDAAGADSESRQSSLDGARTLIAQRQVVLGRAALVAVSLNRKIHVGMMREELRISLHRGLLVTADVGLVVIKIDILDILAEQVFIGHVRSRRR